jgi:hypothetical protein
MDNHPSRNRKRNPPNIFVAASLRFEGTKPIFKNLFRTQARHFFEAFSASSESGSQQGRCVRTIHAGNGADDVVSPWLRFDFSGFNRRIVLK